MPIQGIGVIAILMITKTCVLFTSGNQFQWILNRNFLWKLPPTRNIQCNIDRIYYWTVHFKQCIISYCFEKIFIYEGKNQKMCDWMNEDNIFFLTRTLSILNIINKERKKGKKMVSDDGKIWIQGILYLTSILHVYKIFPEFINDKFYLNTFH